MSSFSPAELTTILIAFASLIISALAFLYTRRSFIFEKSKFEVQEARAREKREKIDISLDVILSHYYELHENVLLRTEFTITNRDSYDVFIRYLAMHVNFSPNGLWNIIKLNTRFNYCIIPNYPGTSFGMRYGFHRDENVHEMNRFADEIHAVIREIKTKKEALDKDGWTKIETGSTTHIWETIVIMPRTVIEKAETLGYTLASIGIEIRLQNEQEIESSSSIIRHYFSNAEEVSAEASKLLLLFKKKDGG